MKIFKLLMFLLAISSVTFVACNNSAEETSKDKTEIMDEAASETMEAAEEQGPEYTSAYICPMHCKGSGSAEPGSCPVCGMAYVANEDMKSESEDGHEGHNH